MRVRAGAIWLTVLGLWMGGLALVLWLWTNDDLQPSLLTGAAASLVILAAYWTLRGEEPTGPRRLAQSSLPTVIVVIGLAMMVNGLTFGLFLILIGAEVAALGVALLVAQHIAERRRG
jgi:Na+/H+ antiporter NhaD/arsenite permease-like protein